MKESHNERTDWDGLSEEEYMIKPATDEEIKKVIQSFKNNKVPGENKINKILLIQLPDNAVTRYRKIIVVGWPKAPAARVHTTIGGLRFGLGLARTA